MAKVLVSAMCYNTRDATKGVLDKFPEARDYDVLLVNDGSTDDTSELLKQYKFNVLEHTTNKGLGAAIKTAIGYAIRNHYDVIVLMAGNGKDNPQEIPNLVKPILEQGCDYVQGSRFLKGGGWDNLPPSRYIMIRTYAILLSTIFGTAITDPLNGFRAYRLDILNDKRINIWQDWLDHYELETYLNLNVLRFKYKYREVAVSKLYPSRRKKVKYSHVRPFIDWWSIIRPHVLISLRIKK